MVAPLKKRKKGAFIVIEGIDGSGKKTQLTRLVEALKARGEDVLVVDFPQYGKPSAALVEMYLNGAFGAASDVTAYQASIFYAVDRFAASQEMHDHLAHGGTIVSNRYVTANQMHQAGKIKNVRERAKFLSWLDTLEYGIFGIPRPDTVIFLDIPAHKSAEMVGAKETRTYLKQGTHDIHERDAKHLADARKAALFIAQRDGWKRVVCTGKDGSMRTIEAIHKDVLAHV
jgi:dTMP kinase